MFTNGIFENSLCRPYPGAFVAGNSIPRDGISCRKVIQPIFQKNTLLKPFSVDLTPGCLLFVPAGCPHKVENLEDSIAVSGNFVNESNIGEAEKHLRISALQDPRAGDLLREFNNLGLLR